MSIVLRLCLVFLTTPSTFASKILVSLDREVKYVKLANLQTDFQEELRAWASFRDLAVEARITSIEAMVLAAIKMKTVPTRRKVLVEQLAEVQQHGLQRDILPLLLEQAQILSADDADAASLAAAP